MKFQHASVIADIDRKKIRNIVRKTCAERRKISLLKDVKIRKRVEEKVIELADVWALNVRGYLKDEILKTCDEVFGKGKKGEEEAKNIQGV